MRRPVELKTTPLLQFRGQSACMGPLGALFSCIRFSALTLSREIASSPCIWSQIENQRPLWACNLPMVHRFLVSDFNLEAIFNFNFNFILKLYNIEVEVEDGLQIKIGDQKSMCLRGGCMPKKNLRFSIRDHIHGKLARTPFSL